jgi:DUF1680 family protein
MHTSPTTFGAFARLAPGQVMPGGWMRDWARINADGWLLRYARNREPGVYDKLWNRNPVAKVTFTENNETVILCDYTAYFADGLMRYATLCPDSELAREAGPWLEQAAASQDADGYLGAFAPQARWQHWLEIFSQSLAMEALLYRCEATGDRRWLEVCLRAAGLQRRAWYAPGPAANPGIFGGHGTILVKALARLYALTGDASHLRFAEDVLERHGMVKAFLQPGDALSGQHNSVGSEHAGLPVMLYEHTGQPALLEASRAAWEMMAQRHVSVAGAPHGNEAMHFRGPLHNCEHCGTVDWFQTCNALARVTGETAYADAAERAMVNAYPAAKSVDGMTVAYMHTPNQIAATEWSQPHAWTSPDWCASRQHYHSAHEPLCCNVNGPRGIPLLVESMVARCADGLAVMYYGPCQAESRLPQAGRVALRMDTAYPFEDDVEIEVTPERPAEFALRLRIPGWCSSARAAVNGRAEPELAPGRYARIQRAWQPGDRVTLHFEVPIRSEKWERSEFGIRAAGVALLRGPLTYALPVAEDWRSFPPPAQGPGRDAFAYRVLPAPGAAWNYALAVDPDHPERGVAPARLPVPAGARPWESPPLGLKVKARKVLNWLPEGDPEHLKTPLLPYNPMRVSEEEETITLVPFGFTHLRMTYLPFLA